MCDEQCAIYGDCCEDSPYFQSAEQRRAVSSFNCTFLDGAGTFYVKQDCLPSWSHTDIRRNCEKSTLPDYSEPFLKTPVTNVRSNITYGNVYCAICNEDASDPRELDYWLQALDCKLTAKYNQSVLTERLSFNDTGGFWQVALDNILQPCNFFTLIPESSQDRVAACEQTINTCPAGFVDKNDTNIRNTCESYTMILYASSPKSRNLNGINAYRNAQCAICNGVPVQDLACSKEHVGTNFRFEITSVRSFSILFNFSASCEGGMMFDRWCRRVSHRDHHSPLPTSNCTKMIEETEFRFVNGKIFVPKYRTTYEPGQYVYYEDRVQICAETPLEGHQSRQKPYFNAITALGIGISVICLCAHLVVFCVLSELRNLSGKNLASLCFALVIAYVSFAFGNSFEGKICFVNAVVTFYFFLATFSWMLIMSFDVWRSLKIATKELRVSSGKQWRKFFIYSMCGWVLPAKIVLIALLVELCPNGFMGESFKPKFGQSSCWFGNGASLLVFFGAPVFVILVCNFSFFVSSAYMIYSSHSMARYSASPSTKRDFRLYARLSVIMGLTWILGLVAGFADNDLLWLLFILSNSFLGLFIFLAFTWRKSILQGLKNLKKDSVLNLPAFNWSSHTSSSDEGKCTNRSQKQTSNTYY